jgi:hypothetical protein
VEEVGMSRRKKPPVQSPQTGRTNWTLISVVAIAAIAIVGIVGMMKPDSVEGKLKEKGPSIEIRKQDHPSK